MAKIGVAKKDVMNFNGGEISPLLEGRVDLDIYGRACRQLQNSIPRKYGNAERRVGTRFVAEAKYADKKCINISFDLSSTVSLNIEMGEYYFRFFRNGSAIMNGSSIYEVSHPYPESALSSVAFVQINDVVYMTHPDYPPYKLSHYADNNWTMIAVPFDDPVFMDMNITSTTITPSGVSGSVTLTASSGIFNEGHIGAYFKLGQIRAANRVEISLLASGTSLPIELKGAFTVRTSGTWAGTLEVQRLNTLTSAWETIYTHISDQDRNVEASYKQEDVSAQWRLVYTFISKDSTSPKAYLESAESYVYGWAKVTAFASSTSVTALVAESFLNTTATNTWYEGAWSSYRGFPSACALFQQRMVYSGTYFQPQTIWGSVTNDYQNFEYGTDDDKAFQYTIGSQERLSTQWLCVHNNALIIGTSTGDWAMSGSNGGDDPVTPTNVIIRRQSTTGDARIQPVVVGNAILHVQRNGKKLYEMTYSIQSYGYDDQDISQFAEHITGDGIVGIAYQRQPDSIIYSWRSDGVLLMCVYDQAQKVIAWSRMVTQGFVESAAVIYGPVGDEVWLVVRRNVNGTLKRLIERLYPVLWDSKIDCWYLDCGYLAWNGAGGGGGAGYLPGSIQAEGAKASYNIPIGTGYVSNFNPLGCSYLKAHNLYCVYGAKVDKDTPTWPMRVSPDGINWVSCSCSETLGHFPEISTVIETNISGKKYLCLARGVDVAAGSDPENLVLFSSNDALTWTRVYSFSNTGFYYSFFYIPSIGTLYIAAVNNNHTNAIYKTSTDGGTTWSNAPLSFDGTSLTIIEEAFVVDGPTVKVLCGNAYDVAPHQPLWLDSEFHLHRFSLPTTGTVYRFADYGGGKICMVVRYGGERYVSADYGVTWTEASDSSRFYANQFGVNGTSGYTLTVANTNTAEHGFALSDIVTYSGFNLLTRTKIGSLSCLPAYTDGTPAVASTIDPCPNPNSDYFLLTFFDKLSNGCVTIPLTGRLLDSYTDEILTIHTTTKHLMSAGDIVSLSSTGDSSVENQEFTILDSDDYSFSVGFPMVEYKYNIACGMVTKKVHTISGLDALAGSKVDALADGSVVPDLTVGTDGSITLPGYYDQVIIGLRYTSIIEPLAVQMSNETGSALSQTTRIRGVDVRLKDTLGLKVTTDTLQYHEIVDVGVEADGGDIVYTEAVFRDTSDQISESPELFTGILEVPLEQHHSKEPRVILKQEAPMPLNVLGMTFKYEITEPLSGKAQQ